MPRSPRGVFRRGRSWYIRLRERGKDRWVSLGSDYEEACRKVRNLRNRNVPLVRITVAAAAEKWLDSYIRTARNPKGIRIAEARVRLYLKPALGWMLLERVTKDDLRSFRLWLEKKPIARQTVRHLLADARCFFRWCEDAGYVDKTPFPIRLLPRIQEQPPDRLSDEELGAIVSLPDPHGFVARFAVETGLRWGELCRAQAGDIQKGMLVVSYTKTGRMRRVPLSPDLQAELSRRIGKLVPFSERSSGAFNRYVVRESGVRRFHVHQLRHTFACRWLEQGGSLAALQQVLGHTTILTTQRYARLTDDYVRLEAERLHGLPRGFVAVSVAKKFRGQG